MKFRYFILKGESLKNYLESEAKEMGQITFRHNALMKDRDDIENFRPGRAGGVMSIKFKEGMQPEGFVRAHKDLDSDEVRPHGTSKLAKPWREILKALNVTEDCQKGTMSSMSLPDFVLGGSVPGRIGRLCYHSRMGHVGGKVYVEVPVSEEAEYKSHKDLKEIKGWEFEKVVEEAEGFDYGSVYSLPSRNS